MMVKSQATIQERAALASVKLAMTDLEGTWVRTDPPVKGIVRAVIAAVDDCLRVQVASVGGTHPTDWGTAPVAAVYAASPKGHDGVAFTMTYDLPSLKVDLHANLSKGLLIIASMSRFRDGQCGEFAREFFRKVE